MSLFLIVSCTKEDIIENVPDSNQVIQQRSSEPELRSGKLAFATPDDFDAYLAVLEDQAETTTNYSRRGFTSIKEARVNEIPDKLAEDKAFASVLNQNATLIVGNYLFKLDFENEKVYAIPTNTPNRLIQQVEYAKRETELPSSALTFSFDDEVFYEIAICNTCVPICDDCLDLDEKELLFNNCDGADSASATEWVACDTAVEIGAGVQIGGEIFGELVVRYRKLGIRFKLFAKIDMRQQDFQGATIQNKSFDVRMPYTYSYEVKCDENDVVSDVEDEFDEFVSEHKEVVYRGWKKLSKYKLTASGCFTSEECTESNGDEVCSGEVSISFGY